MSHTDESSHVSASSCTSMKSYLDHTYSVFMQHTANAAYTLQYAVTRCNTLQHTSSVLVIYTCGRTLSYIRICVRHSATHCNALHHAATCCNTLPHTTPHSNKLLSHMYQLHVCQKCISLCISDLGLYSFTVCINVYVCVCISIDTYIIYTYICTCIDILIDHICVFPSSVCILLLRIFV